MRLTKAQLRLAGVAIAAIIAIVVGLIVWKSKRSNYFDYEKDEDRDDDRDDDDKKKKKNRDRDDDDKKKKKNRDRDDDDDKKDKKCSDKKVKELRELARQYGELGRSISDFKNQDKDRCLSDTQIGKHFDEGARAYIEARDDPETKEKRERLQESCWYGRCDNEILRVNKPCKNESGSKCCNDVEGSRACVDAARSTKKEGDWSCPAGMVWSGSTESGKECTDNKGNVSGTLQKVKKKTTYWDCIRDGNKVADVSIDWGHTKSDGAWACNQWKYNECGGNCAATEQ